MITFLQKYLTINTVHPHPDYPAVVTLFKKYALQDGFKIMEITLPSGNPVLIITLQGSSSELPALALNHHMDVVPADTSEEWLYPPFAGIVHNDVIYGRGTQDCKGLGIIHYAALKKLKQNNLQPERTIHLIIVPDEERGGLYGTKEFVNHPLFNSLNIGYVLDEGMPSGNEEELLIKIDERTPLQVQITSTGQQGHASGLFHHNCTHDLINFLADIVTLHTKQQRLATDNEAGNYISLQITSLTTQNAALNVIPPIAHATIDIRIPSHLSLDQGIILLETLIQKHPTITYEILATSEERSNALNMDTVFYKTLAEVISDHKILPRPFIFEATTDARFYSHRGIQTIGFTPFTTIANLHGTNESITTNDLLQGTDILYKFLCSFCTNIDK